MYTRASMAIHAMKFNIGHFDQVGPRNLKAIFIPEQKPEPTMSYLKNYDIVGASPHL